MNNETQFLYKLSSRVTAVPVAGYGESYLFSDGSGPHYRKWPKGAQLKRAYRRIRYRLSVAARGFRARHPASMQLRMLKQRLAVYGIAEAEADGYLEWYAVSRDAYTHSPENFDSLVEDFFKSSQFSPKVKKLWASMNLDRIAVLRRGGVFLNEANLLDAINENAKVDSQEFVEALTANESFTLKVFTAYFSSPNITAFGRKCALTLLPDSFVTPAWVQTILAMRYDFGIRNGGERAVVSEYYQKLIAARVRRLHPEFDGMPYEWTLKLFSS